MEQKTTDKFYELVINQKMYSCKKNLRFYLSRLFNNVDLAQKEVLDVGGGKGILSFYAATKGAKKAVCLEPEMDGSNNRMIKGFHDFRKELPGTLPVELKTLTLQDYLQQADAEMYDVIIMHNSINHLDEEACISLLKSDACYARYLSIFKNVCRIMKKGGVLIVTDCARSNFFNDMGMRNIFSPTIEWHKHQQPRTWVSLLKKTGFKNAEVNWFSPNRLRNPGRLLMGNYFVSYLMRSYFKVKMEK